MGKRENDIQNVRATESPVKVLFLYLSNWNHPASLAIFNIVDTGFRCS